MNRMIKAETFVSLLVAISLFSIIFMSFSYWQTEQNKNLAEIYQQQQALQIAENQLALQMAGLSCENRVEQNHLSFEVQCISQKISVIYPLGRVEIQAKGLNPRPN